MCECCIFRQVVCCEIIILTTQFKICKRCTKMFERNKGISRTNFRLKIGKRKENSCIDILVLTYTLLNEIQHNLQ